MVLPSQLSAGILPLLPDTHFPAMKRSFRMLRFFVLILGWVIFMLWGDHRVITQNTVTSKINKTAPGRVILSTAKLFGPPTGGVLRERAGSYMCWANQDNDHELRGSSLQEIRAPSEWTKGSHEDKLMLKKAWDFAYRWRNLNLLPAFSFVRKLLSQEIIDRLTYLDYLTHLGNPFVDPIKLDARYQQHRVEHQFMYPCAPWLQFEGEGDTHAEDTNCSAAVSCDACAAKVGCGWCTSAGEGKCKALDDNNQDCNSWDVYQCQPTLIGAFSCGPCTGGTEAVMQMSSRMNQMGIRNEFITTCTEMLRNCQYDVPFLHLNDHSALGVFTKESSSLWTCMGCNQGPWGNLYESAAQVSEAPKYLTILGHHRALVRSPKMQGWKAVSVFHHHYPLMFESGLKMWSTSIGTFWFDHQLPLDELAPMKEDIVVFDTDSSLDVECVKRNALDPNGNQTAFQLVPLKGMSRSNWHILAQKAKVIIDLDLPGYEFGNLEAVLNGAVHIPSAHGVGRNKRDYPIPNNHQIYLQKSSGDEKPCRMIGKRIGEILSNWTNEVAQQASLLGVISRMRNEQWLDLLQFFADDVSVVMSGMTQQAYEAAHAVGFAGSFLYPHASFQVTAESNMHAYWDFNSAQDFYSNHVGFSPFDWELWTPPEVVNGDATILLGPTQKKRLYVIFLPCGYLPVSKYFFGHLATELERRNHRHWLICPATGLVFARQWWYSSVQADLVEAVKNQPIIQSVSNSTSMFSETLFRSVFGSDEITAASLDPGFIHRHGFFLYGDN